MYKKFQQTRNKKELSQPAKGHPKVKTILNCERLTAVPQRLGTRQDVHPYQCLFICHCTGGPS